MAPFRAARDPGVLRRLWTVDDVDGGAVGPKRRGGIRNWNGADGAANGARFRTCHRRHARAGGWPSTRVSRVRSLLRGCPRAIDDALPRAPKGQDDSRTPTIDAVFVDLGP